MATYTLKGPIAEQFRDLKMDSVTHLPLRRYSCTGSSDGQLVVECVTWPWDHRVAKIISDLSSQNVISEVDNPSKQPFRLSLTDTRTWERLTDLRRMPKECHKVPMDKRGEQSAVIDLPVGLNQVARDGFNKKLFDEAWENNTKKGLTRCIDPKAVEALLRQQLSR